MNKIINKRIYVKNLPLCWIPHPALCSLQLIWPTNIETENLLQNAVGERYQLSETKSRLILFSRSFPKRSFGGEYYAWCQEGRTEYARSMQGRGKMWVLWHVCLAHLLRIPAGASQEEGRSSRLLHLPWYNGTVYPGRICRLHSVRQLVTPAPLAWLLIVWLSFEKVAQYLKHPLLWEKHTQEIWEHVCAPVCVVEFDVRPFYMRLATPTPYGNPGRAKACHNLPIQYQHRLGPGHQDTRTGGHKDAQITSQDTLRRVNFSPRLCWTSWTIKQLPIRYLRLHFFPLTCRSPRRLRRNPGTVRGGTSSQSLFSPPGQCAWLICWYMLDCSPCICKLYNFTYTLYMDMFYCSPCTWRSCWNISRESTRPPHKACLPLLRCRGCSLGQEPDDRHGQHVYECPGLRVYDHGDDGDVHHGQDV